MSSAVSDLNPGVNSSGSNSRRDSIAKSINALNTCDVNTILLPFRSILPSPFCFRYLTEFAKQEISGENILFYQEVQCFREYLLDHDAKNSTSPTHQSSLDRLEYLRKLQSTSLIMPPSPESTFSEKPKSPEEYAMKIFDHFIADNCSLQVCCVCHSRSLGLRVPCYAVVCWVWSVCWFIVVSVWEYVHELNVFFNGCSCLCLSV